MAACYPKNDYDYEAMKLDTLYTHPEGKVFVPAPVQTESSRSVCGEFLFPRPSKERIYTMACFVGSIDGKVAFPDDPAGPVVAKSNKLDPAGAEADFWFLNLFRANADVVIGGAVTMQKEPDGVVCIFDQPLEDERVRRGLPAAPWMVINSLDGTDIPFGDKLIDSQPVIFHTSPAGKKEIEGGIDRPHYFIGPYNSVDAIGEKEAEDVGEKFARNKGAAIPVIITGEGGMTEASVFLTVLKILGFQRALVESPSYCHVLLQNRLLDELLFNTSGVYIGGDAVGMGNGLPPFTSTDHPHTEILSLYMHSPSFTYTRYRFR